MGRVTTGAPLAVVAGSGLDLTPLFDAPPERIAFGAVPGLCSSTVDGHGNAFLRGACGGHPLVVQCGRLHLYEGLTVEEAVRPVDALADWGCQRLLLTNAAGGLAPDSAPGDLVAVGDIWCQPFRQWPGQPRRATPDFLVDAAPKRGRYMWVHGPCYETRAEVRALQRLGGSVVGMSTAPELVRAQALGIAAGAVSCVTNRAGAGERLSHDHVLRAARAASAALVALVRAWATA